MVHPWAHRKHHYLDQYAGMFTLAMRNRWPRRTYIDLFAGPGRCYEPETDQFFDGSPRIGLKHGFTDRIYVEMDDLAADALAQRCSAVASERIRAAPVGGVLLQVGKIPGAQGTHLLTSGTGADRFLISTGT